MMKEKMDWEKHEGDITELGLKKMDVARKKLKMMKKRSGD